MTHRVRVAVRGYEVDALGHVNQAVYHQWGEHGRTEFFKDAGCGATAMRGAGIGTVMLESTIRFLREVPPDADVDILTGVTFGEGKTFRMRQEIRLADDTVSAEISSTLGVLDLQARRLRADPRGELLAAGARADALADPALAG